MKESGREVGEKERDVGEKSLLEGDKTAALVALYANDPAWADRREQLIVEASD